MSRPQKLPPGMWKRGRVYYARFRAKGREVRQRLSTDFRTACELLNELKARTDRTDFGLVDNDYPWARLRNDFLTWAKQAIRNWKQYETDLDKFEEYIKPKVIREIDVPLLVRFRQWRLDQQLTPRTVNRQLGTIKNMLNKGVEWGCLRTNPIADLKPLPHDIPKKQRRSLTLAEVQAFLAACPEYLRPVFLTYMTTGLRRSELVKMMFRDVDFQRRSMTVTRAASKNHKIREVPLDDTVLGLIASNYSESKRRQPVPGLTPKQTAQQAANFSRDHVFVTQVNTPLKNNLLKRFYSIAKRAGIEDAHPGGAVDIHALRVTFITLAIEHGGNPKAIQMVVGHSSLEMTMNVYAKATDKSKRDAISALPFASVTAPANTNRVRDAHKVRTAISKPSESVVR